MKTTKRFLAIAIAALALGACQKENGNLLYLDAEGMHNGTKMEIDGNHSYWANGDMVRIYDANNNGDWGSIYQITVTNGQATIDVSDNSSLRTPIIGLYPSDINNGYLTDYIHVNLPEINTYVTLNGRQHLQTPMIAYTESGNRMRFKHITGAVTVEITNDFGIDIKVTNITVSSNLYQLSGTRSLPITDIASNPVWVDTVQTDNADDRQVQMTFSGTQQLIIPSGGSAQVQLPVLPVGRLNKFTVSVTVQNKDAGSMGYIFTKEQSNSSALLRAEIGYAPVKFGGKFHYQGGYVRFAPGNLQYNAYYNTWRFAGAQWEAIGNAAGNTTSENRESQMSWIDLFGYGTSGNSDGPSHTAYQPWATSTNAAEYWSNNLSYDRADGTDWGVNDISNGWGSWRTPNWSEIIENNDIAYANINSVYGLIILPEGYDDHPLGIPLDLNPININYIFDLAEWRKMEIAGAVFLPAAGYRSGTTVSQVGETGYYWSCLGSSSEAFNLNILNRNVNAGATDNPSKGFAVRLIRVD